jgi:hypothetical protein
MWNVNLGQIISSLYVYEYILCEPNILHLSLDGPGQKNTGIVVFEING